MFVSSVVDRGFKPW